MRVDQFFPYGQLTQSDDNGSGTSAAELSVQQPGRNADIQQSRPRSMDRSGSGEDSFHICAHDGNGSDITEIYSPRFQCVVVDQTK